MVRQDTYFLEYSHLYEYELNRPNVFHILRHCQPIFIYWLHHRMLDMSISHYVIHTWWLRRIESWLGYNEIYPSYLNREKLLWINQTNVYAILINIKFTKIQFNDWQVYKYDYSLITFVFIIQHVFTKNSMKNEFVPNEKNIHLIDLDNFDLEKCLDELLITTNKLMINNNHDVQLNNQSQLK